MKKLIVVLMGVACGKDEIEEYDFTKRNREKHYFILKNCKEYQCVEYTHLYRDCACVDYIEFNQEKTNCISLMLPSKE